MAGIKPPSLQQIWRFSSAHLRKVISKTKWSVIQYMKEILEVLDHRERAESIVSWSGLHLKYNAIFFYARAGESASCQFFAASSERSATFFTPRVQWKLWKVHLNYPIDTCGDGSSFVPTLRQEYLSRWTRQSANRDASISACLVARAKTRWHDRDRFRLGWAGCNQCRAESDLSGNQRLCAERIWLEGFKFIYFSNQKEMWNRSRREL